jgi:hypothetical protein
MGRLRVSIFALVAKQTPLEIELKFKGSPEHWVVQVRVA